MKCAVRFLSFPAGNLHDSLTHSLSRLIELGSLLFLELMRRRVSPINPARIFFFAESKAASFIMTSPFFDEKMPVRTFFHTIFFSYAHLPRNSSARAGGLKREN